jgi:hypothetical protein
MGGGLMQLVAYGAQDIYLTGNPQITFFKVVYRRHTNFSMESIEQTFNGTAGLGKRVTATISRNGDLVNGMWLEVQTTIGTAVTDYGFGNALVKTAELEIGGQLIDKHYGEWMNIWGELSTPAGKLAGYDLMVGNISGGTGLTVTTHQLDVPLQFWFCRNPGLALPLIALQYHEVKLVLELRTETELTLNNATSTVALDSFKLWVDYVYLDTDERRRFAQISHEYLIEQVQFTGDESTTATASKKINLNFNHPCKELVWVLKATADPAVDFNNSFTTAKLQLNGHDRFAERRVEYFLNVQNYKHHTRVPRYSAGTGAANLQKIYTYSFALQPEEHQPSGTCNFSRIDNAVLTLNTVDVTGVCKVFAVNYNVLRIMSGMGGLAYSN